MTKTNTKGIPIFIPEGTQLHNSIRSKAKKEGYEHQESFWLRLFLIKLWKLDKKKFLTKEVKVKRK